MAVQHKVFPSETTVEFGDFQTPEDLANHLCLLLKGLHLDICSNPQIIVEPTCGKGSFILACAKVFPQAHIIGFDINEKYVEYTRERIDTQNLNNRVTVEQADFFRLDWQGILPPASKSILIVGNPPWVTSAQMQRIGGINLPEKSNIKNLRGYDAISGKGNFDISEWMILQFLNLLQKRNAAVAMLCKFAVARRLMEFASSHSLAYRCIGSWSIDAKRYFKASVEACFHVFCTDTLPSQYTCPIYVSPQFSKRDRAHCSLWNKATLYGIQNNTLVANIDNYLKLKNIFGEDRLNWRSGIKHDRAKVMELQSREKVGHYHNGFGDEIYLEDRYIYPLLKSSDVKHYAIDPINRRVIVTQEKVGEPTAQISQNAPQTWKYLQHYKDLLRQRKSSIYSNQPDFSIFGVGPYAFKKWKVAISGLYKSWSFILTGPYAKKPVMFDDTCYYLGFDDRELAEVAYAIVSTPIVHDFFETFVFWDAKRPITKQILEKVHLGKLASYLSTHNPDLINVPPENLKKFITMYG